MKGAMKDSEFETPFEEFGPKELDSITPHFKAYSGACVNNGCAVFPLKYIAPERSDEDRKKRKHPAVSGWNSLPIDEVQVTEWCGKFATGGVGLRLSEGLFVIDVDIDCDSKAATAKTNILAMFPNVMIRYRADSSRFSAFFRTDDIHRKGKVTYVNPTQTDDPKVKDQAIEILSCGQYVMIFGTHDYGAELQWIDGRSPATVPVNEWPLMSYTQMMELMNKINSDIDWVVKESNIERCSQPRGEHTPIDPDGDGWSNLPAYYEDSEVVRSMSEFVLIDLNLRAKLKHDEFIKILMAIQSTCFPREPVPAWVIAACTCTEYPDAESYLRDQWAYLAGNTHGHPNPILFPTIAKIAHDNAYTEHKSSKEYDRHLKTIKGAESVAVLTTVVQPAIAADGTLLHVHRKMLEQVLREHYNELNAPDPGAIGLRHAIAYKSTKVKSTGVPSWAQDVAFIEATCMYLDKRNGRTWSEKALNTTFNAMPEVVDANRQPSFLLSREWDVQCFADTIYAPGKPQEIERDSVPYLNVYKESEAIAKARLIIAREAEFCSGGQELIDLYEQHLATLFPDVEQRGIYQDFVAFRVQNPDIRINYAIVIQGPKGVGKSTLGNLLRSILGMANCGTVAADNLKSGWTDWAEGGILAIVDEIRISGNGRFDVMERMKSPIADDYLALNIKFRSTKHIENFTNYILFTNHVDAVPIDDDDRRYAVLATGPRSQAEVFEGFGGREAYREHFTRLRALAEQYPEALALHCLRRDLSHFNPKAQAPMTEPKRQMALAARPEDEVDLDELIEEHKGPAIGDDYIDVTLLQELATYGRGLPSSERIAQILTGRGMVSARPRVEGKKHRVYSRTAVSPEIVRERVSIHREGLQQIKVGNVVCFQEFREGRLLLQEGHIQSMNEFRFWKDF